MGNRFREKVVEEGLAGLPQPLEEEGKVEDGTPASRQQSGEGETASGAKREKRGRGEKAARALGKVLGGDVLAGEMVLKQIPLLLLCLVYLLLIVGNRYRVESLSREKAATEERINYLREHRIQMQKQYQQSVKISQIAEDLKGSGVGITSGPPYEL